jgi:hypothetical protein
MSTKFEVEVIQTVEVEFDLDKFTQEIRDEFNETMFKVDTLSGYAEHIGQLAARGLINGPSDFVEGYGRLGEVGIKIIGPDVHTVDAVQRRK